MKIVYRRTTIQLAERSGLNAPVDNKKRYIDPKRLLRMSVMVSVVVSQMGMTELMFVNYEVKVNGLHGSSITAMSCSLSRCFQQSNVSQNVAYSQNNMWLTAKLVIFCVL